MRGGFDSIVDRHSLERTRASGCQVHDDYLCDHRKRHSDQDMHPYRMGVYK